MSEGTTASAITVEPTSSGFVSSSRKNTIDSDQQKTNANSESICCDPTCLVCCDFCSDLLQFWCCLSFWHDLIGGTGETSNCCDCCGGCDVCCEVNCCDCLT